MKQKLCIFALAALLPALAGAQETKYVNCRTLEAAGNFIGSDETLVNNMVCQVVKGDAAAVAAAEKKFQDGPKPVRGVTISGSESLSVAEAARIMGKKSPPVAKAATEKAASDPDDVTSATVAPAEPVAAPAAPPAAVAKPEPPAPAAQPVAEAKPEPAAAVNPPASENSAVPEVVLQTAPVAASTSAQPESPAVSAASATEAPVKAEAAAEPAASEKPSPAEAAVASVVSAPPSASADAPAVPAVAPPPPEVETPATEKGSGFYDANATTKVETVAGPAGNEKTAFAAGEPASPPAEAATVAVAEATAAPALPPQDDPNEERERIVQLGAFEKPSEVKPDPEMEEHRSSFQATEEDGFREGQRPECTKNITLGSLRGETLVLGTPEWAAKWIEKNQKHSPQVCFSGMPMAGARNYLIVFYTPGSTVKGAALKNADFGLEQGGTPASGFGSFTTSFGATWHYSYDRTVGVTINTRSDADQPHSLPGQVLYATAYTEEGVPVAQHWPGQLKKQVDERTKNARKNRNAVAAKEQVSSELLNEMVEDLDKL
jgi:hypothetical protein